jgi:hypothetical protein
MITNSIREGDRTIARKRNMCGEVSPHCSSTSICNAQDCQPSASLESNTCSSSKSISSSSTRMCSNNSSRNSDNSSSSSSSSSTPAQHIAAATFQPSIGKQQHTSSAPNLTNTRMQERLPPRLSSSTGSVVSLICEGVKLETWLVGLQHKLLLGVAPKRPTTCATAAAPKSECFCSTACNNTLHRPLYRLLQEGADFAERACLDRRFLCQQYLSRLVFAGAFFFGCAYINALATMISTHRNPNVRVFDLDGNALQSHTLPDLGHYLWSVVLNAVGHHTDYIDEHSLPDKLVSALGHVTLFLMACHPRRFMIFRRVFMIFGLLLLMRAVSVSVTVLPDASPVCHEQFTSASGDYKKAALFPRAFYQAAQFVLRPRSMVTCGDM